MNSNSKIYINLLFSFLLIPAYLYAGATVKAILLIYPIFLVLSKDAAYLPSIIVQVSYMSNSYPVYFFMLVLSIINYRKIKYLKIHKILIILLICLPLVIYYSGYNFLIHGQKIGLVLNQFGFYFSLYAFFYGTLISDSFDNKVTKSLIITLFLLSIVNIITNKVAGILQIRLIFFILPLLFSLILYYIISKKILYIHYFFYLSIIISTLIMTFNFKETTFTIIFTILYSLILIVLYFRRENKTLYNITGIGAYIILFLMVSLTVLYNNKNNLIKYKSISMAEIESFEDISLRFKYKFFEDRGKLWASSWQQIKENKNWTPPLIIEHIKLRYGRDNVQEFEYHSHNVYIEFLRTNGIILGVVLSLIFIKISLLGRKILKLKQFDSYFIVLVSVSISSLIVGSITGIYPLLSSFAICGLSIPGVAYAKYYNIINQKFQ